MAGHVAPEAPHGGPIAAVREGDVIKFDIEARRLDVELTDEEIKTRIAVEEARQQHTRAGSWRSTLAPCRPRSLGAVTS